MVVYADVLIVLNLIVDYFLIALTARLARLRASFPRQIVGAVLGGVSSLYIFLPRMPIVLETVGRVILCAVLCLVSFGFGNLRRYLRAVVILFGVTFGYAGAMMALWAVFRPKGMAINNSVVYFNISPLFLILFSVAGYLLTVGFRSLLSRRGATAKSCEITVFADGRTVSFTAIADTGNSLEDVFGLSEIIIAERDAVDGLFGDGFSPETLANRYRALPCNTVSGDELLDGYRCDKAYVRWDGKTAELNRPVLAVSKSRFGGDYSAIVNPKVLED